MARAMLPTWHSSGFAGYVIAEMNYKPGDASATSADDAVKLAHESEAYDAERNIYKVALFRGLGPMEPPKWVTEEEFRRLFEPEPEAQTREAEAA